MGMQHKAACPQWGEVRLEDDVHTRAELQQSCQPSNRYLLVPRRVVAAPLSALSFRHSYDFILFEKSANFA